MAIDYYHGHAVIKEFRTPKFKFSGEFFERIIVETKSGFFVVPDDSILDEYYPTEYGPYDSFAEAEVFGCILGVKCDC